MEDDASPQPTRALLIKRLRNMLKGLERAKRQPNRREAYYICQAMEHLKADRLPESEAAVFRAVNISPLPPDLADKTESNRPPTLPELQQALDRLAVH